MRVLAGDIGGTKTDLRLYVGESRSDLSVERAVRYESQSFSGLTPILGEFLRGERVDCAGFGVPGPVMKGTCRTTNLPWDVTLTELQKVCATPACTLLNDVQAAALGIAAVPDDRKVWLQHAPCDPHGPIELVAVGTGFGRAFVIPGVGAFPSEGGHASFAPRNTIERRLLEFMALRHDPVAIEHVLAGPAIYSLYQFIVHEGLSPATAQFEIDAADDPSAVIGRLGVRDIDPASSATIASCCSGVDALARPKSNPGAVPFLSDSMTRPWAALTWVVKFSSAARICGRRASTNGWSRPNALSYSPRPA